MDELPPSLGDDIRYIHRHDVTSSVIKAVMSVWDRRQTPGGMMTKDAVDPFELKHWLPYLTISEFHDDPFRVRYRLVGTEVVRFVKRDFTGIWLHESGWEADIIEMNRALYHHVYTTRRPLF